MKIHEILEARMSPRAYQRSLKQVADETLVGFELEFLVPPGSLLNTDSGSEERDAVKINSLSYADIPRYFIVSPFDKRRMERDYADWLEAEALDYVEDNYESFMGDDVEEGDARDLAKRDFFDDHAPDEDAWLERWFESVESLIKMYDLEPVHGLTPDGSSVYTNQEPDNTKKVMAISENVVRYLRETLDLNVGITTNYARWSVVTDESVEDPERGSIGLELVSPPLPASTALEELERVIGALQKVTYTNETTGLHVNLSIGSPEKMGNLDLVKLVLFMGDKFVLNMFDRSSNKYAKSQVQNIINALNASPEDINPGDIKELRFAAKAALYGSGKYSSVNIDNLPKYLEFRAAGGEYYKKLPEVREVVGRWITAMHIAMDPQMYRKEYLKKLTGLLQSK